MVLYRLRQAADAVGVSWDTMRRWVEAGRIRCVPGDGPLAIEGEDLARLARELGEATPRPRQKGQETSPANRFVGVVTAVTGEGLLVEVEVQAQAHRLVSVMSQRSAEEAGVVPGVLVATSVAAFDVRLDAVLHPAKPEPPA